MANEHEEVKEIMDNSDPNAEYAEPSTEVAEEAVEEEVPVGHQVASEEPEETVVEEPAYEPDYSFNVRGKQLEFDDWAKPLVTDKESEEYFRSVMAKVHGIEAVQESRDKYKSQYEQIEPEFTRITSDLGKLAHYRDTNNMKAFQQVLGLSDEHILSRAQEILNYNEMDPQQRAAFDQQNTQSAQNYDLAAENQQLQQQYQEQLVRNTENEVNQILSQPEMQNLVSTFDQRMGKDGAFVEEVWNRGRYHAMVNKTTISAQQAVDEVLKMVGAGQLEAPQAPAPAQQVPQAPQQAQPAVAPPVIPKVSGSGASPTRPVVRSINDLRQLRQDRFGS